MAIEKDELILDNGKSLVFNSHLFGSLVKYEVDLKHTKDTYLGMVSYVYDHCLSITYANTNTGELDEITVFANCLDSSQHLEVLSMGGFYQSLK